jgi:hypothetical protein
MKNKLLLSILLTLPILLGACNAQETRTLNLPESSETEAPPEREYKIVTLLVRDAIPAIDDPEFLSAEEADEEYAPDEMVIGVEFGGEARAYSIPKLSRHEIVNDTVGDRKIAVTW